MSWRTRRRTTISTAATTEDQQQAWQWQWQWQSINEALGKRLSVMTTNSNVRLLGSRPPSSIFNLAPSPVTKNDEKSYRRECVNLGDGCYIVIIK